MYATDFIFDGVNLSSKGYMICTFDGDSIVSGGEIKPIVKKTPSVDEYTYYAAEINNVLTWELGICKLPCGTEAFEPLNQYEESELAQFLLKTDGYRWLQFVQPDDYPDVFYKVYINMTPYQIGGQTFGYNLTITSNCGYGFSHEYTATLSSEDQPLTINVNNDLNRYIYPTVSLETNSDECYIYNENDLEQNLENGKECRIKNLGDNVETPRTIFMDSGNDLVQGLEYPDQFNFHYLRLVDGENNIYSDGILSGEHYSTTEWAENESTIGMVDKDITYTENITHIHSTNGIRTSNKACDYILSGDGQTTIEGSANINSTISVPNDDYTSIDISLKKLLFSLERSDYNYIYLYKIDDYHYKLVCTLPNTKLYHETSQGGYTAKYSNNSSESLFEYEITISSTTGDISNVSLNLKPVFLEEVGATWLYVPVDIKEYMESTVVAPVTRIVTPELIPTTRVTSPLFDLNGLPNNFKTATAFNLYEQDKGIIVTRDDNEDYKIWISTNQEFWYRIQGNINNYELTLYIRPGSGIKLYEYNKTNHQWSLTYDSGGTYSEGMSINGVIGDVVYIAPHTTIKPYANFVEDGLTYDYSYSKWEIYNGGQFIAGGNDADIHDIKENVGTGTWGLNTGTHGLIYNNIIKRLTGSESYECANTYVYNATDTDKTYIIRTGTHSPESTITIPANTTVFISYGEIRPHHVGEYYAVVYEPYRTFVNIPETSYFTVPLENAVISNEGAYIYKSNGSYQSLAIANVIRSYYYDCDISDVMAGDIILEYDKYDPIESEQTATIKYREIRRVLV